MTGKYKKIEYHKSFALLIGIDDYKNWQEYGNLNSCVESAIEIDGILKKFGFDQTRLFITKPTKEHKALTTWELPTRENILNAMEQICRNANDKDDRVLIYFSGHGNILQNHHVLIPFTGKYIKTYADILSRAKDIKAKHIFFIIDACHSGESIKECTLDKKPKLEIGDDSLRFNKREIRILTSAGVGTATDYLIGDSMLSPFGFSVVTGLQYASMTNSAFSAVDLCIKVVFDSMNWKDEQAPISETLFDEYYGRFLFQNGFWDIIPSYYIDRLEQALRSKRISDCEPLINIFALYAEDIHSQASFECLKYLANLQAIGAKINRLVLKRLVKVYSSHFNSLNFYYYTWTNKFQQYDPDAAQDYFDNLKFLIQNHYFNKSEQNEIIKQIKEIINDEIYPNLLDKTIKQKYQSIIQSLSPKPSPIQQMSAAGKTPSEASRSEELVNQNESIIGAWKGFYERNAEHGDTRFCGAFELFIEELSENEFKGYIHEPVYLEMIKELNLSQELLKRDYLEFNVEGKYDRESQKINFTEFCRRQLKGDDINWNVIFDGKVDFNEKKITGNYSIEVPDKQGKAYKKNVRFGTFQLYEQ